MKMEIKLDRKADAMYIKFRQGEFGRNKRIDEDTIIDIGKEGELLGIEFLNVTERISPEDLEDVHVKLPVKK